MNIKLIMAAAALVTAAGTQAAVLTTPEYSVSYTGGSFGGIASSSVSGDTYSFQWTVPNSVTATGSAASPALSTFVLPSFTLTAAAGYTLGDFSVFLGNLSYVTVGGGSVSATGSADFSVDGSTPVLLGGSLVSTITSTPAPGITLGYLSASESAGVGSFSSLAVTNTTLVLGAGGGITDSIYAQPQNFLSFSFTADPVSAVPEPASAWLLLAGAVGLAGVVRRRGRRSNGGAWSL
jgi:hypothetical protein